MSDDKFTLKHNPEYVIDGNILLVNVAYHDAIKINKRIISKFEELKFNSTIHIKRSSFTTLLYQITDECNRDTIIQRIKDVL